MSRTRGARGTACATRPLREIARATTTTTTTTTNIIVIISTTTTTNTTRLPARTGAARGGGT
eukprot:1122260-Pyramimonas_sp.AAC.1